MRVLLFLAVAVACTAVQAAVVEDKDRFGNVDGRGALDEKAGQLGLSAADVDRLRGATGYIVCPGSANGNGIVASAALVESAQVILTVGHAFVDEAGRARAPLDACVFRNQTTPPTEVRLVGGDAVWIGLKGPAAPHDPRDYAVALLSRPVAGAAPFRFRSGTAAVGERGVGIVAWQEIEGVQGDPGTPIVQDCAVRDLDPAEGTLPTNYLTDCDLGPVGSGGHLLIQAGGDWVTIGVFSSSGGERSVGRSFSRRLGSFTRVVGVDAGVAAAIEKALAALQ